MNEPAAVNPGLSISGTYAADTLVGGFGDDTINGLDGNDSIDGGIYQQSCPPVMPCEATS